ncbi:MAG: SRPBCC family protein [Pseudomonadota bacterium]
MKAKHIHCEIPIRTTSDRMWKILSQYGDVSKFHAGVVESHRVDGSENTASLGCERVCNIVDMGLNITLKERIVEYDDGKSYQYEVYEWKNFPIQKMLFRFTILSSTPTHTTLAIDFEYKAKPAVLTPLIAGKMRRLAHDVLLGYKHFTETGETRIPIKQLKKRYQDLDLLEAQYG